MQITRRGLLAGTAGLAAGSAFAPGASASIRGDTLVIAQTGDIISLDPAFRTDTLTGIVQRHIYDPVLERRPDMSVGPCAASEWKRLDPVTWRLKLAEGRKFSNGVPVDTEAMRFTLARLNDDATRSPIKDFFDTLIKVTVDSPTQITIQTKGPDALFEARMTNCQLIPPNYKPEAPVGSGAYVLDYWKRNQEVSLSANPTYGGPAPRFKKLLIRGVPEEIARISAVRTGETPGHLDFAQPGRQPATRRRGAGADDRQQPHHGDPVQQGDRVRQRSELPPRRRAGGQPRQADQRAAEGLRQPHRHDLRQRHSGRAKGIHGDFPYDPDQARSI